MHEQLKEELITRFRTYLETEFDPASEDDPVDHYSLFSEISGLKNEVRIESRQLKSALDDFRAAFATLDGANQDLADRFLQLTAQQGEREQEALQPVVFGLMDLYDRLLAGLEQKPPRPNVLQAIFNGSRQNLWLQAHQEGQKMLLNRVLDLLRLCEVSSIEVTDLRFDPATMKAVQFAADSEKRDGMVLKECRKGFVCGSRVIRPAEVLVNKIQKRIQE